VARTYNPAVTGGVWIRGACETASQAVADIIAQFCRLRRIQLQLPMLFGHHDYTGRNGSTVGNMADFRYVLPWMTPFERGEGSST